MPITLTYLDGKANELFRHSLVIHGAIRADGDSRPLFYATGALLPRLDSAQPLTSAAISVKDTYSWKSDEVAVLDLDPECRKVWQDFWIGTTKMEPSQIHRHTIGQRILRDTYDRIHQRFALANGTKTFGFTVNYPAMRTTTVDVVRGELCGIHFDSWESRTTEERLSARKRISINLGPGPRWFLFVPRRLESLARDLPAQLKANLDPTTAIIDQMRRQPESLVCIALCLRPGQAYIAPTECILHDATSMWSQSVNYSAQYLVRPSYEKTVR